MPRGERARGGGDNAWYSGWRPKPALWRLIAIRKIDEVIKIFLALIGSCFGADVRHIQHRH